MLRRGLLRLDRVQAFGQCAAHRRIEHPNGSRDRSADRGARLANRIFDQRAQPQGHALLRGAFRDLDRSDNTSCGQSRLRSLDGRSDHGVVLP